MLKHETAKISLGLLQESMENHKQLLRRKVEKSDLHCRKSSVAMVD